MQHKSRADIPVGNRLGQLKVSENCAQTMAVGWNRAGTDRTGGEAFTPSPPSAAIAGQKIVKALKHYWSINRLLSL